MALKDEAPKSFLRRDMFGVGAHIPKIREIDVDKIAPNPDQPRKFFDPEPLNELAASIDAKGLIQPIVVKPVGDGSTFVIVAGERRFRAIQQIKWTTLPAIVTEGDTDEIALIENMQREGLQPLEEAEAVDRLMEKHNYSLEDAARSLGKSKSTVSELLSILKLPDTLRDDIRTSERQVSKSALIELAKMEPEAQQVAWEAIKAGQRPISVRATREVRKRESIGQGSQPTPEWIKGTVRGLYTFAKRAKAHEGEISPDDLKALKEAKKQADDAYRALVSRPVISDSSE